MVEETDKSKTSFRFSIFFRLQKQKMRVHFLLQFLLEETGFSIALVVIDHWLDLLIDTDIANDILFYNYHFGFIGYSSY